MKNEEGKMVNLPLLAKITKSPEKLYFRGF